MVFKRSGSSVTNEDVENLVSYLKREKTDEGFEKGSGGFRRADSPRSNEDVEFLEKLASMCDLDDEEFNEAVKEVVEEGLESSIEDKYNKVRADYRKQKTAEGFEKGSGGFRRSK